MRKSLLLVGVTSLLCTALIAQRRGRDRDREPDPLELEHFVCKFGTFESPSVDRETAKYAIYLPKGYDDEKNAKRRYPVAIWLHGMNGSYRRFHDNHGPEILDKLRADDTIPEMIFVAASANRRPVYLNGTSSGNYEDMIVKDLVSHLEAKYRVAEERNKRAIMGVSIGGTGALKIAMSNVDSFGAVAVHSALVLPETVEDLPERMRRRVEWMVERFGLEDVVGSPIDMEKWKSISHIAMAKKMDAAELKKLAIYFDAGTDDRYRLAPGNQALHAALENRGVPHHFELVEGGRHAWGSGATQQQLPKSLRFIAATFRGNAKPPKAAESKPTSRKSAKKQK